MSRTRGGSSSGGRSAAHTSASSARCAGWSRGGGRGRGGAAELRRLEKELGDVVFDTLLLVQVAQLRHGCVPQRIFEGIDSKLRHRCPYIFPGGPTIHTKEDAEALWLIVTPAFVSVSTETMKPTSVERLMPRVLSDSSARSTACDCCYCATVF